MTREGKSRKETFAAVFLALALGLVSTVLLLKVTYEYDHATALKTALGDAHHPFQLRILSPLALAEWFKLSGMGFMRAQFWFYYACFAALYGLSFRFFRGFFDRGYAFTAVAAVFVSMTASALQNTSVWPISRELENYGLRYTYDVTQVLFFLGLVHLLLKRRLAAFAALFALATFNRESTIVLLPAAFFVWMRDPGVKRAAAYVAVCGAAWFAVRWILQSLYPGPVTTDTLANNLAFLAGNGGLRGYLALAMTMGGLWVFFPVGWWKVPGDWRRLSLVVPALLFAILLYGNLWEIRVYNELIVPCVPVIVAGIAGLFGDRQPIHA